MSLVMFIELNYKDPEVHFKVDIGLPKSSQYKLRNFETRLHVVKANKENVELERKSRLKHCKIFLTPKVLVNSDGLVQN